MDNQFRGLLELVRLWDPFNLNIILEYDGLRNQKIDEYLGHNWSYKLTQRSAKYSKK